MLSSLNLGIVALIASSSPCPEGESFDEAMAMCMPGVAAAERSNAQAYDAMTRPDGCGAAFYYQFGMSMCLPRPAARGRAAVMLMGNAFATGSLGTGPRFAPTAAAPDWLMVNAGIDLAPWNRLDLDVMLTAERWLYPAVGYRELLQIGEHDAAGRPYVDAQHPHSSPLMGLALTDVIALGGDAGAPLLRLSFAPRGETTDGPIAFMHRATATVNPDAPLGHHIGQDVGHVTSTVFSASLVTPRLVVEASTFHGQEPEPTHIDLPLGRPDSYGARAVVHGAPWLSLAGSVAYVEDPEADHSVAYVMRYSASAYARAQAGGWRAHAALIWGGIAHYDHAAFLQSVGLEAVAQRDADALWGRAEVLQRTDAELAIASTSANEARVVGAASLGYTRRIVSLGPVDLTAGVMGTLDVLPAVYAPAYGGRVALVGRGFVAARVMQMFRT